LAILLITVLSGPFASAKTAIVFVFGGLGVFLVFFSRYLDSVYTWFEHRFVKNLSDNEPPTKPLPLAPWDAHIARIEIPPESPFIGQTLQKLKVREQYGVTVALIERGSKKISAPRRDEFLYPNDIVSIIGNDDQVARFKIAVTPSPEILISGNDTEHKLQALKLTETSEYIGKSIRDSGIREKYNGLVVGVERNGERILNPDSTTVLQPEDLLWVVGETTPLT
jgi:CPA2 family monovalent cation:H+ antiporter-2